jgi:hypothetical protein
MRFIAGTWQVLSQGVDLLSKEGAMNDDEEAVKGQLQRK